MAECAAKSKDGKPCKIPTREGQRYCHIHRRQRIWRWIISATAIGLFALGILGFAANITGLLDYFGINPSFLRPQPTVTTIGVATNDIETFREMRFFRLVWRIYFDSAQTDDTRELPSVPNRGGIHLVAFIPYDELYHEAYWDERMHIAIKTSPESFVPFVELIRNHIASPFRRYDERTASLVQSPALGHYLSSYWELEERTTGADLEKLWYQVYFLNSYLSLSESEVPDDWQNTVQRVVVMADNIPLAVFDLGEIPAAKPMDKTLIDYTVDPYTGEVAEK